MGKILNKRVMHTEMDFGTGKMQRIESDETIGYVDAEPDYVKIYIGTQLCLNNLDPGLAPYIIAFSPYMTYANNPSYQHMVQTSIMVRQGVAATLNVTPKRVEQIIKILINSGIFIPIFEEKVEKTTGVITRKKRRGIYFVNPFIVAKGSWKDIKKLQQNIDFVNGVSSYVIDDEMGERKIKCALPIKAANHQLSFNEQGFISEDTDN